MPPVQRGEARRNSTVPSGVAVTGSISSAYGQDSDEIGRELDGDGKPRDCAEREEEDGKEEVENDRGPPQRLKRGAPGCGARCLGGRNGRSRRTAVT